MELMLKDGALQGKSYIITGGGTGLGKAMTEGLLRLGAKVAITSRKSEVLENTKAELESLTGGEVLALTCDVRDPNSVDEMIDSVIGKWGLPSGLVNNAAGNFIAPTETLSANAFSSIIDIVLKGTIHTTLSFGKKCIEKNQKASILNIVTTYASTGSAFVVPSACAKAGVQALTRSLAVEWGKYGIRTNAIAPGAFPTKGAWERLLPGNLAEKFDFKNRIPVKRVGRHEELVNAVTYLLSDFSGFVNGEIFTMDGGEWLQGAGQFSALEAIPTEMWTEITQMIKKTQQK